MCMQVVLSDSSGMIYDRVFRYFLCLPVTIENRHKNVKCNGTINDLARLPMSDFR